MRADQKLDVIAIIGRVAKLYGCDPSMLAVSKEIGVPYRTLQNWKAERGSFDIYRLLRICEEKGVSLDWLLLGRSQRIANGTHSDTALNLLSEIWSRVFVTVTDWPNGVQLEMRLGHFAPDLSERISALLEDVGP